MKPIVRQFIVGAFGLIALFLVLTHSTGFSRSVGSSGTATAGIFKTLQGR
jgi:hypothetical protein